MKIPYPLLTASLSIGTIKLRNRMVMGAMHTRLETLDRPGERLVAFYRERARGGIGLILTGGHAPNQAGRMDKEAPVLDSEVELPLHRSITDAVHDEGGRIVLQILHAGRYGKHPLCVGPSTLPAPINHQVPAALSTHEVQQTVDDYVRTARLAQRAGYDGVEIMGSEGYLINQFISSYTNTRDDHYGGCFTNRIRFPLEIVRAVATATSPDFLLIYRISAIDLVEGGLTGDETAELARQIEAAGARMLNTGIGWHEALIPTIAGSVPPAAWRFSVRNVKQSVNIPVIASNRINSPIVGETLLADGVADLVSLARPLLSDPEFARKTINGEVSSIAPCIACNQSCLDRIFTDRTASCLVNPRAGREIDFVASPLKVRKNIAVVGAGPAGVNFAIEAAARGHAVTLFEATAQIGGQLNLASVVPGKHEFSQLLRYYQTRLENEEVTLRLNHKATVSELKRFDEIVLATGTRPRILDLPGSDGPNVWSYTDVLRGTDPGNKVLIIGTGGIGHDVAAYLLLDDQESKSVEKFATAWGVDTTLATPGGLVPIQKPMAFQRHITLLQRSAGRPGARLGKSTGWILKTKLRQAGVKTLSEVRYERIDEQGLHCSINGQPQLLEADGIIICAGQLPERTLQQECSALNMSVHLIGGAESAFELDAAQAIEQSIRLAMRI